MKHPRLFTLVVALSITGAASAAWNRLPVIEEMPVDLADHTIKGTKIISSKGIENTAALLDTDFTKSSVVSAGKSEFVIQLPNQQVIDTVYVMNDGLAGTVSCASSTDSKDWVQVGQAKLADTASSGEFRTVTMHFAAAQAKYLRISFDSSKSGSISSLSIYGASSAKDFKLETSKDGAGGSMNLIFSSAGGRPIYAFPAPKDMGDVSWLQNSFHFPSSNSKFCTIVFDLSAVRTIKEFTCSYTMKPMRLEVFAFDTLPEKKDWRGKLTLDPAIFDTLKPVVSGVDAEGSGNIKLVPSKPVSTQYLAMRFEVNYNRNASASAFTPTLRNIAVMLLGSGGSVLDHLGLIPQSKTVAASDNSVIVHPTINSASNFTQSSQNGNEGNDSGGNDNKKKSGNEETFSNGGGGGGSGGFYNGGSGGGGGGGGGGNNGNGNGQGNNGNGNGNGGGGGKPKPQSKK